MKKEYIGAGLCFAFVPFAIVTAVLTHKPLLAGLLWSVMPTILGLFLLFKGLLKRQ